MVLFAARRIRTGFLREVLAVLIAIYLVYNTSQTI